MTFAERTMRLIVAALILIIVLAWLAWGQEVRTADERALERAERIWGGSGKVSKHKVVEQRRWVYQVGCDFEGQFIVAGEGDSWSDAFEDVNMLTNGPRDFGGKKAYACNKRNQ